MQKVYQRINWENDPSTNTPINEDNLNRMDYALDQIDDRVVQLAGYQDRVAQSEANAKKHADDSKTYSENAKESEDKAKESELKAKQYMEGAFSGTPEGYSALVEQVEAIDIKTSNEYELFGTKKGGYRLTDLVGATEQKSLSGKNLLPYPYTHTTKTVDNMTFTDNGDGSVTINGTTSTATAFTFLQNGDIPMDGSYILSGLNSTTDKVYIQAYIDGSSQSALYTGEKTFEWSGNLTRLSLFVSAGATVSNLVIRPMIRKADITDSTYEEFCGGTPSPNQEFPQVIENYADVVGMEQGGIGTSNGSLVSANNRVRSKHYIPCKSGDTIKVAIEKISKFISFTFYNESGFVLNKSSSSWYSEVSQYSVSVPDGATKFKFVVARDDDFTPETVGKITLTVNGKYVGQIVEHGKNLLSVNSCTLSGAGSILPRTPISLKVGVPYTISLVTNGVSGVSFDVILEDENQNTCGGTKATQKSIDYKTRNSVTITPSKDASYIRIYKNSGNDTFSDIMLEQGEVATDYEPYIEKVTTFYLNEPLRATDRLVRKDGVIYENHRRGSVVLNGSETWSHSSSSYRFYTSISGLKKIAESDNPIVLCSHYTAIKGNESWQYEYAIASSDALYICHSSISTVEDFKAQLQASPITVEYDLAEETFTPLDTQSQIALNDMVTFDGMTYIEADSKVKPSSIKGKYGTSEVGALALENANLRDNLNFTSANHKVANNLATTEEGFVLDARMGTKLNSDLVSLEAKVNVNSMSTSSSLATKYLRTKVRTLQEVEILGFQEGFAGVGTVSVDTKWETIGVLKINVPDGLSVVRYNDNGVRLYNHTNASVTVVGGSITVLEAHIGLIED